MWNRALKQAVTTLTQRIDHMDAQVANVVADVALLKTNIVAVNTEITNLLAQLKAGIDAEDEAAIAQAHTDLVAANTALAAAAAGVPKP